MTISPRIATKTKTLLRILITLFFIILFLTPFYFLVINSFKTLPEISKDVTALPNPWTTENFVKAWNRMKFPTALKNSILATVFSLIGVVLFASLAAYRITRHPSKFNKAIYIMCLAEMIIPFQVIMIPLIVVLKNLNMINKLVGLIFADWGLGMAMGVFMYSGFVKGIPKELEEAAEIEGCSQIQVFSRIVFPLLKPITFTLVILDTFWFWNDYLLPSLVISKQAVKTIPIAMSSFFEQYFQHWELALPALAMAITPAIIAFLLLQKNIVDGLVAGAVKL